MPITHGFVLKASLATCLFAHLVLALGCAFNRELLETPLPQSYFLPSPPGMVWKALIVEASKPSHRVLVQDEVAHLLSWVGEVEPAALLHRSLTDPKVTSGRAAPMAITTARVESSLGGSKLTLRSTYYTDKPFLGVSSSRGNHEQEILRAIRNSLIMKATSHVKNQ
jgi:hypothetical protein